MRSHRWRSVQSGLPESAHGCPELVKHAFLVEANGMCRNRPLGRAGPCQAPFSPPPPPPLPKPVSYLRAVESNDLPVTLRAFSLLLLILDCH